MWERGAVSPLVVKEVWSEGKKTPRVRGGVFSEGPQGPPVERGLKKEDLGGKNRARGVFGKTQNFAFPGDLFVKAPLFREANLGY